MTAAVAVPSSSVAPPTDARCLGCGYALRALASRRCPECSRAFDAADPWTMAVGRPHGRLVAAMLSPIGRPTFFAAGCATLAVFWWIAGLPCASLAMALGLWAWTLVYAYRAVRFVARNICAA